MATDKRYENLVNELDKANIVNEENIAKLKKQVAYLKGEIKKIKKVLKAAQIMSLDA